MLTERPREAERAWGSRAEREQRGRGTCFAVLSPADTPLIKSDQHYIVQCRNTAAFTVRVVALVPAPQLRLHSSPVPLHLWS